MNDDGSHNSQKGTLKSEWTLLLDSFVEEENPKATVIQGLPQEFIHETMRELSVQKHSLFQQIEDVKSQIEETHVVIENLQLVGSDTQGAHDRIADLHEQGATLTETIHTLDKKIKKVRTLAG
ncbi:hypothetical protein [Pseudobdellovibrio sp. HCB154]|uniref:hypothetical protein n=1 Tax=Pseudobdellovibrio sp. HCB154 TaxID=3386277 RepID=UPI00391710D6